MNKRTVLIVAMFVILAMLFLKLPNYILKPRDSQNNTVTVAAHAEKSVTPDLAYLTLGVVAAGADIEAVKQQVDNHSVAVVEALAKQGIDKSKINTATQFVQPTYRTDKENNTMIITGYRVQNSISVVVENIDQLSQIIKAATQNGANQIQGIRYALKDVSGVRQELLQKAMQDSQNRANQLAKLSGKSVGDIVSMTENTRPSVIPGYLDSADVTISPVNSGILTVDLNVGYVLQ